MYVQDFQSKCCSWCSSETIHSWDFLGKKFLLKPIVRESRIRTTTLPTDCMPRFGFSKRMQSQLACMRVKSGLPPIWLRTTSYLTLGDDAKRWTILSRSGCWQSWREHNRSETLPPDGVSCKNAVWSLCVLLGSEFSHHGV